jgi:hypothetical protein
MQQPALDHVGDAGRTGMKCWWLASTRTCMNRAFIIQAGRSYAIEMVRRKLLSMDDLHRDSILAPTRDHI